MAISNKPILSLFNYNELTYQKIEIISIEYKFCDQIIDKRKYLYYCFLIFRRGIQFIRRMHNKT
jgi:hypothetical protein